ncbi:AcrR family transcriptional regulator [Pseudochelatococcus lubricantis]|uniref:AcrR family transcriptional regulator n=1 Tax=Pseudochelatococcus lubricantis TaxID=1538102 RepID=A0ABX0V4E5_9HYPH|nr:TetR/AcrR family transcriptional regulator [Pseudochelatococcus lubricantis]NIJ59270.1 AcrR family transcriptional regulator [Pseudochelatococcus lubricantis]
MTSHALQGAKPRKTPVQSRSRVTVDAIFEATIQVLLSEGMARLTTTRVAERAGVSVGTMYQYFPNKLALIIALNERYLNALAERVEQTCARRAGHQVSEMVAALIETYWTAKTERADLTQALYRSVAALDNNALMNAFATRVDTATTAMFRQASDLPPEDAAAINLTLTTVIYGAVRNAFERELDKEQIAALKARLTDMCCAWLRSVQLRTQMTT